MKKIFPASIILFGLLTGGSLTFSTVAAQTAGGGDTIRRNSDNISIRMMPEIPDPRERIDLRVESFLLNVDNARITWIVNDRVEHTEQGAKEFTYTLGGAGETTVFEVVVESSGYGTHAKTLSVTPVNMDILWEANTYAPPFYKGKKLPSSQSEIKFIALPNMTVDGRRVASHELIYQWKKDYNPIQDGSGFGRSVMRTTAPRMTASMTYGVTASIPNTDVSASRQISILGNDPDLLFYERKPLQGIRYEQALGETVPIKENEITLTAEPYFFSFEDKRNNPGEYTWFINNQRRAGNFDKSSLTVGKPENGSGSASVRLEIFHPEQILQNVTRRFNITF